ncbi:MAG TPA: phosphatase PAP2 family protein, partial [Vulgatibacter sp.]|nr:phosphatase PAP2 family protein [Vulgatibacter sp.]
RWWFFRAGPPGHLDFDLVRHGLPLLGCAAVWMGAHGWRKRLPPMSFVRARTDARGGERVNTLDREARERLMWKDPLRARFYSNLLANFLVPAGTVGLAVAAGVKGGGGPLSDVLVANEAMVYAGTISQAAKIYFRRQRPFARFAHERPPESERPLEAMEAAGADDRRALALARANQIDDDDLSFFSSHTSTTAAFAFAVAQIATRRRVRTPLVFLLGIAAGLTGYLRIASDRHYLTDVLAGGVVGATVGTLVPRWLHPVPKQEPFWRDMEFLHLLG